MASQISRTHHRTPPASSSSPQGPACSSSSDRKSYSSPSSSAVRKLGQMITFSDAPHDRIKVDPETALKRELVEKKNELDKKNQVLQVFANAITDATQLLGSREELTPEHIKQLKSILNIDTLFAGIKSPAVEVKRSLRTNRPREFVDRTAADLDRNLLDLNESTEDLYAKIQKNEMSQESIKKSLDKITDTFSALQLEKLSLTRPIEHKIAVLEKRIAQDDQRAIKEGSITDIAAYERVSPKEIVDEIQRRKNITDSRTKQKDLLTVHWKSIIYTEKLLYWNIQKIYLNSVIVKAMEDVQIGLQNISKSKHQITEDHKPGSTGYAESLSGILTNYQVMDHRYTSLIAEAHKWLEEHQLMQNQSLKIILEGKDFIAEEIKDISIDDHALRSKLFKLIFSSLEKTFIERRQSLNDIKAMIIRMEMDYEEAKWNVQALQIFGDLLEKIEGLSDAILKLCQSMESAKTEHREVAKSGGNYREKKYLDQLNLFIQTYNDLSTQTRTLFSNKETEIGKINALISDKSDINKVQDILAKYAISCETKAGIVAKDISDNLLRMIATLNSVKHKVEANWKGIFEKMHNELPPAIDRMNWVLTTTGAASWLRGDIYPIESLRNKTWFPEKMVSSPFGDLPTLPMPIPSPARSDGAASSSGSPS